jgi:hypothetical protein
MVINLQQRIPNWPIAVLVAGVLVFVVVLFTYSPAPAAPTISWTPSEVVETIGQGETKTTVVSFTSEDDLEDVVVWIVPELSPYVSASPSSFSSINEGDTLSLTLTFSAPTDAPLGTLEGTLHLRESEEENDESENDKDKGKKGDGGEDDGDDDDEDDLGETLAQPLPITINVWSIVQQEGYALLYPPDFEISEASDDQNLGLISPSTQSAISSNAIEAFDDISLVVVENPEDLPVSEFAKRYDDGWFENYVSKEEIVIGGRSAVRYSDIGAVPGRAPMVAVFIDGDSHVFIFTINRYEGPESIAFVSIFDQIISSFEIQ